MDDRLVGVLRFSNSCLGIASRAMSFHDADDASDANVDRSSTGSQL